MIVNGWQGSRRRPTLVVVALMLAGLVLAILPGVGWADPDAKSGGNPTKAQPQTTTSAKSTKQAKPAKARKAANAKKPAKSKKSSKATKGSKSTKAAKSKKPAESGKVGAMADPSTGWPQTDHSARLPQMVRDELTGDFLGLGYDQRMRVENSSLNIYNPPALGGGLIKSTATDLWLPNHAGLTETMWGEYGNMISQQCAGCLQLLDTNFHLSTILLATDGKTIYMTGVKGTKVYPPNEGGTDTNRYRNLLYAVPYDGSCASESCAHKAVELDAVWQGAGHTRSVGVVSMTAAMVGGKPIVVLGQTDWGVSVTKGYDASDWANSLTNGSVIGGIFEDGVSQSPATALALDSSGFLVIGVAQYNELVYVAQVNSDGSNALTAYWQTVTGSVDRFGNWGKIPISAAIGIRPDGSKQAVLGFSDGKVYIPNLGANNDGTILTQSPTLSGYPSVINPIPRLDLDNTNGHTDYAVASATAGTVTTGTGYYFQDMSGTTALTPQVVGADSSGNPVTETADFDAFRSWFPGYKSGAFTVVNQLSEPISVAMHSSSDSGKGCWNGTPWLNGPQELVNGKPITLAAGASSEQYAMGAYTAGTDGRCAGNPQAHPTAAWRGYLEITPVNRPADTRVVNIQLNPDTWQPDVSDQQGGSLQATLRNNKVWSAFGAWELQVTGPDAPSELESAGPPTLTGYQLTPASTVGPPNGPYPTVYRLDVGPTTWSVPGLAASPAQVQALLPPLQVEGRADSTSDWVKVGQLMPNGQANVKNSQVTLPGASFYWENVTNGPTYTQFRVLTAGPNPLTSQVVDLTTLQFCYTGTKPGGPCIPVPTPLPSGTRIAFQGTPTGQKMLTNGLDQVALTLNISPGTVFPPGDDAYNKVFYRQDNEDGDLVTNLFRQDAGCSSSSCYGDYVSVQPSVGAYLNNGASTYAAVKRTALGGTAAPMTDYASATGTSTILAKVRLLAGQSPLFTSTATITGYDLGVPKLVPGTNGEAPSLVGGFGLTGCSGEPGDPPPSCLIAPTTGTRGRHLRPAALALR